MPGAADSARRDHVGPPFEDVLAAQQFPYGAPFGPAHTRERLFARDRAGAYGLVATIRTVAAGGWWWAYTLLADDGDWDEGGETWPIDPAGPRPAVAGFAHVTDVCGELGFVCGGVAGTPVASVEAVTPSERHFVEVGAATGAFTAIGLVEGEGQLELIARAADGTVLDSASVRIDTVTTGPWDPPRPVVRAPVPGWLRPALDAALADLRRSGGGPERIGFSWEPNGEDAGVFYVSVDGQQRWGAGIATRVYRAALQVDVAFRLQEGFDELSWRYGIWHPACPRHAHALDAEERDDEAWWVCPEDGTPIARIGEYGAAQRAD